jgi:hypothetical protein
LLKYSHRKKKGLTMQLTHHADQRMNQRGISRRLMEFAVRHGRVDGDKLILDRKESLRLIEELNEELRLAKQVLDKGGIAVIDQEDTIITTYKIRRHARHPRFRASRGRS